MSIPPLPQRRLPLLDPSGSGPSLPWYRWFQSLLEGVGGSGGGTVGPEGPAGPSGAPGPPGPVSLEGILGLSLLDGSGGISSVTSATADLTVSNPHQAPVLTVVSAPKWDTARTLSFTGDATGSNTVDGSANVATGLTLATVNSNVGTFGDATHVAQIAVNAKGLITAVTAIAIAFPIPTFGVGAPVALVSEGALYFDTTVAIYVGYVQHSGAWNQIA